MINMESLVKELQQKLQPKNTVNAFFVKNAQKLVSVEGKISLTSTAMAVLIF